MYVCALYKSLTLEGSLLSSDYLKEVLRMMQERTSLIPRIPVEAPYFWTEPDLDGSKKPPGSNAGNTTVAQDVR